MKDATEYVNTRLLRANLVEAVGGTWGPFHWSRVEMGGVTYSYGFKAFGWIVQLVATLPGDEQP